LGEKDKKKYIIVRGIAQDANERWTDLEKIIVDLEKQIATPIDFDHVFRLGKVRGNRPILVQLLRTGDKLRIIHNRNKLKETNIYINERINEERQSTSQI